MTIRDAHPRRLARSTGPFQALRFFAVTALLHTAVAAVDPSAFDQARTLFETHRPAEAQQAFEKLLAADPKDPEVNYYLGQLANRRNESEKATGYFQQAVAVAPNVGRYHHGLGDAFGRSAQKASVFSQFGLAKKCVASYERAVALEPDNADFRYSLFEYYRQAPGLVGGGYDKAVGEATAIKKINPTRGRIAFATLYAGEKKYDLAIAEFDDVLKLDPDNFTALYQIGRLAAVTGQFADRGIASLRHCLELPAPTEPDTPGHAAAQWRLGILLQKKSDLDGARRAFEAGARLDPTFAPVVEALAKLDGKKRN